MRPEAPPFLVIHGRSDTTVPFSQAERFVEALKRVGAKDVTFKTFDDAAHGVFAQKSDETQPLMDAFFARTLKAPQAEEAWPGHGLSETECAQIWAACQWGIDRRFIPSGDLLIVPLTQVTQTETLPSRRGPIKAIYAVFQP